MPTASSIYGPDHMVIHILDGTMDLEITYDCRTNCPWCYKKKIVRQGGENLGVGLLQKRIDWIVDNTDAKGIIPIGGEPLAHPQYQQICDYILSKGKICYPITSGKIPPGLESNLDYLVNQYKAHYPSSVFSLSYQIGRNHDEFFAVFDRIWEARAQVEYKYEGKEEDKPFDLFVSAVIEPMDREQFLAMMGALFVGHLHLDPSSTLYDFPADPDGKVQKRNLTEMLNYAYDSLSSGFGKGYWESMDTESIITQNVTRGTDKFRFKIRLVNSLGIERDGPRVVVTPTSSFSYYCPGISSDTDASAKTINFDNLLMRTDGHLAFPRPSCINTAHSLGNADSLATPDEIYAALAGRINWLKRLIFTTKRANAKTPMDFCMKDEQFPSGDQAAKDHQCKCDFPVACNICANPGLEGTVSDDDLLNAISDMRKRVAGQYVACDTKA